ncbi:MAG TPA: OmpA family protein [Gammaproteobacteria bacterium]|nr:OmpA family protein [Gammaproteobacteria bacterium]
MRPKSASARKRNRLRLIGSRDGSVIIHQDVDLYTALLAAGDEVAHRIADGRKIWVQAARGSVTVNGEQLRPGDGRRRDRRTASDDSAHIGRGGAVGARVTMALLIEFDADQADVGPHHREELRRVANFLNANPRVTATVEGHSAHATPEIAQEISQLRAQNVVNYLVGNFSVARSRLTAQGFGQTRRFAYNTSAEGPEENRRINVVFDYPK